MTGSAVIVALVGWVAVAAVPTPTPEPGVQVDPDSPSGKEYAIPLEDARRRASPSGETQITGAPGGGVAAPLFGAGVTAGTAARSAGNAAPDDGDANASPRRGRSHSDPTMSAPPPASVLEAASRPGAPSGGAGQNAVLVGGAALLLGLAVAAGVLLRRRSRG